MLHVSWLQHPPQVWRPILFFKRPQFACFLTLRTGTGVTVAPIPIELDGLDPPVPAAAGLEADTTAASKAAGGKAAGQQGDQAAATPSWQTLWGSGSSVESSEEDDLLLGERCLAVDLHALVMLEPLHCTCLL